MKTSKIIAAAALTLLAAAGAQAETYEGVHPLVSANSRTTVRAEAVAAAHSAKPYSDAAESGVPAVVASTVDRATVRSQAVAAAHSADPYAEGATAVWHRSSRAPSTVTPCVPKPVRLHAAIRSRCNPDAALLKSRPCAMHGPAFLFRSVDQKSLNTSGISSAASTTYPSARPA